MPPTSATLLERLRNRADAEAWRRLVDLYSPLLSAWLRRHALQDADVEDLVQEVLLTVSPRRWASRFLRENDQWQNRGLTRFDGDGCRGRC